MAARYLREASAPLLPAKHTRPSLGRRCDVPVLEQKLKKISCYRAWLLLMQFPSRNVDFSNPGLIGRRREEKL